VRSLLQLAAALTLVTLGVCAAVITMDLHRLLNATEVTVQHAQTSLGALDRSLSELNETALATRGVLRETQATAQNLRAASAAETAYWNATAKQTSLAARDMRQLIARTDRELNDKFLPDLDTQLAQTSTAAQFSFESVTKTADDLDFQIKDPDVAQTLHSFNLAAASLASASANGNSILGHADHVAAYYDKKLTTPLGFWKSMLHEAIPAAGAAGSIAAGFVR
jgi:hypothetical protein